MAKSGSKRRGEGTTLWVFPPGKEYPDRKRCGKAVIKKSDSRQRVVAKIPRRCIRERGQVQLSYVIHNIGGFVTDSVPGGADYHFNDYTRWLKRG